MFIIFFSFSEKAQFIYLFVQLPSPSGLLSHLELSMTSTPARLFSFLDWGLSNGSLSELLRKERKKEGRKELLILHKENSGYIDYFEAKVV